MQATSARGKKPSGIVSATKRPAASKRVSSAKVVMVLSDHEKRALPGPRRRLIRRLIYCAGTYKLTRPPSPLRLNQPISLQLQ